MSGGVNIKVGSDVSGAVRGLREVSEGVNGFGSVVNGVTRAIQGDFTGVGRSISGLKGVFKSLNVPLADIGIGKLIGGITGALSAGIAAGRGLDKAFDISGRIAEAASGLKAFTAEIGGIQKAKNAIRELNELKLAGLRGELDATAKAFENVAKVSSGEFAAGSASLSARQRMRAAGIPEDDEQAQIENRRQTSLEEMQANTGRLSAERSRATSEMSANESVLSKARAAVAEAEAQAPEAQKRLAEHKAKGPGIAVYNEQTGEGTVSAQKKLNAAYATTLADLTAAAAAAVTNVGTLRNNLSQIEREVSEKNNALKSRLREIPTLLQAERENLAASEKEAAEKKADIARHAGPNPDTMSTWKDLKELKDADAKAAKNKKSLNPDTMSTWQDLKDLKDADAKAKRDRINAAAERFLAPRILEGDDLSILGQRGTRATHALELPNGRGRMRSQFNRFSQMGHLERLSKDSSAQGGPSEKDLVVAAIEKNSEWLEKIEKSLNPGKG